MSTPPSPPPAAPLQDWVPNLHSVAGIGCDIVHIPSFTDQCSTKGSAFTRLFSAAEVRYAHRNCNASPFEATQASFWGPHLAARWAAREAFVKAWSSVLSGTPPLLPDSPEIFSQITVTHDRWSRPVVQLHGQVAQEFEASCPGLSPHLSLSHDGDYALAVVALSPISSVPCP